MPAKLRLAALTALLSALPLVAADPVILQFSAGVLSGGKFGFAADVQNRLNQLPATCRPARPLVPDGQFGPGTRDAIVKAAACPGLATPLPADSAARRGALTEALWNNLFPGTAKPSVHDRAMVLVLTQEATDYIRAEWNFCQNSPAYDPAHGQPVCFSNDPHSFLTWGPRGATAGNGAEVQQVLAAVDADPAAAGLIDQAFGPLAPLARRLVRLDAPDTERFLCANWLDPQRRQQWKDAFTRFGAAPQVRQAYEKVYASSGFDGGKIERFYELYRQAGVVPTEVDYAFMVDRATQMSAPSSATITSAATAMRALGATAAPAGLRRWLAQNLPSRSLPADRLARDVVFYIDALDSALTADERAAWQKRNRIRASDAGLSDSVPAPTFSAAKLPFAAPARGTDHLTASEQAACPAAILNPRPPSK